MGEKIIKSYYGNVMLLKKYCPKCQNIAIVIQGRFTCCNTKMDITNITGVEKKRESTTNHRRSMPGLKIQKEILSHQNYQCIYCGCPLRSKTKIEYDHFIPFVYSQSNHSNTFVAGCGVCNGLKSSFLFNSVEEARIYILNKRKEKGLSIYDYFGGSYEVVKL